MADSAQNSLCTRRRCLILLCKKSLQMLQISFLRCSPGFESQIASKSTPAFWSRFLRGTDWFQKTRGSGKDLFCEQNSIHRSFDPSQCSQENLIGSFCTSVPGAEGRTEVTPNTLEAVLHASSPDPIVQSQQESINEINGLETKSAKCLFLYCTFPDPGEQFWSEHSQGSIPPQVLSCQATKWVYLMLHCTSSTRMLQHPLYKKIHFFCFKFCFLYFFAVGKMDPMSPKECLIEDSSQNCWKWRTCTFLVSDFGEGLQRLKDTEIDWSGPCISFLSTAIPLMWKLLPSLLPSLSMNLAPALTTRVSSMT